MKLSSIALARLGKASLGLALSIPVVWWFATGGMAPHGHQTLQDLDIAGQSRVSTTIALKSTRGVSSNHVALLLKSDAETLDRIKAVITIRNETSGTYRVSGADSPVQSIVPSGSVVVLDGSVSDAAFIVSDLKADASNFRLEVRFDRPMPLGTRLIIERSWADGP